MKSFSNIIEELADLGIMGDLDDLEPSLPETGKSKVKVEQAASDPISEEEAEENPIEAQFEAAEPDHARMIALCDRAVQALDELKSVFTEIREGWKQDKAADEDEE